MKVQRHFVFLEFVNPEIRALLTSLRDELHGYSVPEAIHVTVCGPYKTLPDEKVVQEKAKLLEGELVAISDAGFFKTAKGYAVYLCAYSKVFDDIWWKPDFSGPQFRKIPHITMYETTDKSKAEKVLGFLKAQTINIITRSTELTVYSSKQTRLDLGFVSDKSQVNNKHTEKIEIKEKDSLVARARQLHYEVENSDEFEWQQFALI